MTVSLNTDLLDSLVANMAAQGKVLAQLVASLDAAAPAKVTTRKAKAAPVVEVEVPSVVLERRTNGRITARSARIATKALAAHGLTVKVTGQDLFDEVCDLFTQHHLAHTTAQTGGWGVALEAIDAVEAPVVAAEVAPVVVEATEAELAPSNAGLRAALTADGIVPRGAAFLYAAGGGRSVKRMKALNVADGLTVAAVSPKVTALVETGLFTLAQATALVAAL